MSKDDLISNLGTLARSGTTAFLEQIQAGNMNLIGQFGVGFYSAFLVADQVEVISRTYGHPGYKWFSNASNEFHVEEVGDSDYGTKIVLHLKEVFSIIRKPINIVMLRLWKILFKSSASLPTFPSTSRRKSPNK